MSQKKVLLIVKVNVVWSLLDEFNEYWGRVWLPHWKEKGAKHLGSFTNIVGGPVNQVIRLFEFEDMSHYERFNAWMFGKFEEQKKGKSVPPAELLKYIENLEQTLLISVY